MQRPLRYLAIKLLQQINLNGVLTQIDCYQLYTRNSNKNHIWLLIVMIFTYVCRYKIIKWKVSKVYIYLGSEDFAIKLSSTNFCYDNFSHVGLLRGTGSWTHWTTGRKRFGQKSKAPSGFGHHEWHRYGDRGARGLQASHSRATSSWNRQIGRGRRFGVLCVQGASWRGPKVQDPSMQARVPRGVHPALAEEGTYIRR